MALKNLNITLSSAINLFLAFKKNQFDRKKSENRFRDLILDNKRSQIKAYKETKLSYIFFLMFN